MIYHSSVYPQHLFILKLGNNSCYLYYYLWEHSYVLGEEKWKPKAKLSPKQIFYLARYEREHTHNRIFKLLKSHLQGNFSSTYIPPKSILTQLSIGSETMLATMLGLDLQSREMSVADSSVGNILNFLLF
jgi:hypothetical protein